jgi:hypothetical protein
MSLATNFVCRSVRLSQKNPFTVLRFSYDLFRICSIKNSTFSQHMCCKNYHVPMMFCKIHDVAEAARRREARNEVREGCHSELLIVLID